MQRVNFDKEMQKIISLNAKNKIKPTLLLHSCCAPCSSSVIERLSKDFDLTVFYYNPNIDDEVEYNKRLQEQKKLCEILKVKVISGDHFVSDFYTAISGHENCLEGGERCFICYGLRLEKTALKAREMGFDYFTTTLSLSPLKNAEKINEIGKDLELKYKVKFLPSDFKKRNGYFRSIELSKEYNLYRQNFCGCSFSKAKLVD